MGQWGMGTPTWVLLTKRENTELSLKPRLLSLSLSATFPSPNKGHLPLPCCC